jgi:Fe2+ or Zn2+ uptake regulation protein
VKTTQLDLESARQRHLERLCRQHHLPVTIQRRAVYEALCRHQDHPSADQLHLEVKATVPGLSRASIYRILEALVAMGAARKISHPGAQTRFDPKVERHHHLICEGCRKIRDLDDQALDGLDLPHLRGFVISDYSIHFRGLCAACARVAARPAGARPTNRQRSRT